MEYKLGNSKKIKSFGETNDITCPNCKKDVKLSVFSNNDTRFIAKLPLIESNSIYFLVCPECSSIYTVNNSNGKSFKNGNKLSIMQGDLKNLKEFNL